MRSIDRVKEEIEATIARSSVPEDPLHSRNTLEWLLRLDPGADEALRIAALGHDIERAVEERKVRREDFSDFDEFKAAHAEQSALMLGEIMTACGVDREMAEDVCRLVRLHEVGGDPRSDLLKDADAISFFDVNLSLYLERNGRSEAMRRAVWGFRRLSARAREAVAAMSHGDLELDGLLREVMGKGGGGRTSG